MLYYILNIIVKAVKIYLNRLYWIASEISTIIIIIIILQSVVGCIESSGLFRILSSENSAYRGGLSSLVEDRISSFLYI